MCRPSTGAAPAALLCAAGRLGAAAHGVLLMSLGVTHLCGRVCLPPCV
jgi:hypothetical protein